MTAAIIRASNIRPATVAPTATATAFSADVAASAAAADDTSSVFSAVASEGVL